MEQLHYIFKGEFEMEVKKTKIYFAKTKENAIIPSKRTEDGCYDLYACIDHNMLI